MGGLGWRLRATCGAWTKAAFSLSVRPFVKKLAEPDPGKRLMGFEPTTFCMASTQASAHDDARRRSHCRETTGSAIRASTRAIARAVRGIAPHVGEHGQHAAVGVWAHSEPKLQEHLLDVCFDGALGDEQTTRYRAVRESFRDQP
jgi:hypothetical protein